jgi:hypothetical protein
MEQRNLQGLLRQPYKVSPNSLGHSPFNETIPQIECNELLVSFTATMRLQDKPLNVC